MTREEAKEVFLNRGFIDGIYDGDKWREACIVISKWLEQEPTTKNDLGVDDEERKLALMYLEEIKEDYIESVGYERHPLPEYYAIETAIKLLAMPSVTPQEPRWIPIDERLPEINEEAYSKNVLLSLRETKWDIDACRAIHITTIGYYDVNAISSDGVYLDTEGWVLENERRLPLSDVLAWMPLPKPYKAESENP